MEGNWRTGAHGLVDCLNQRHVPRAFIAGHGWLAAFLNTLPELAHHRGEPSPVVVELLPVPAGGINGIYPVASQLEGGAGRGA